MIEHDSAYLWTDARYFLQAEQQLNSDLFELMRQQQGMAAPIHKWLMHNANNKTVGVDPKLISVKQAHLWQDALTAVDGKLSSLDSNLIDAIWHDQPSLAYQPIKLLDQQYTGLSTKDKLIAVRAKLKESAADALIVTMLDAIAWLFNIRGTDIQFNPLAISYAIVTHKDATFFINPEQINADQKKQLATQGVTTAAYTDFANSLQNLSGHVLIEANTASWWIEQQLTNAEILLANSPITLLKAIKNSTEQQGMQEAHRRDAIAVCKYLHWLEQNWQGQTELSAATKLEAFRREDPQLQDLSFTTISGFGEHGAIIHYSANETTDRPIEDNNLYLVDSGGQYLEGTTDITRTVHLGTPSEEHKHLYTLVLKGHLGLRHTQFPDGTNGEHINAIAHRPLWQEGMDFGHGTGHGVGCYLCVHEGPQRISGALTGVALKPGMIVSNEPGVYLEGKFGIRIENLCLIQETLPAEKSATGHGPFYRFSDLTMVPYARNLINKDELTKEEIQWIDQYHHEVHELLKKDVPKDIQNWLKSACQPL